MSETHSFTRKINKHNALCFLVVMCSIFMLTINTSKDVPSLSIRQAHALCRCGIGDGGSFRPDTCARSDCNRAVDLVQQYHDDLRRNTRNEFDDDLAAYQDWLRDDLYNGQVVPAIHDMSTQMAAVAMFYVQAIGAFLDAQTQMDTQRLFRELQYEAHQDYTPSEDFCWFGSNVKSLAGSQNRARYTALALSQISLTRQTGPLGAMGADSVNNDYQARWNQFVGTYCNPRDNNFQRAFITGASSNFTGLRMACDRDGIGGSTDAGGEDRNRFNIDISYTRLIEDPKTLEVNFVDDDDDSHETLDVVGSVRRPEALLFNASGPIFQPGNEEDVIAMSKNLYGHRAISRSLGSAALSTPAGQKLFLALRGIIAKRSVAQASFNAIVGLKASGTTHELGGSTGGVAGTVALAPLQTRRFLASIVRELMPTDPLVSGIEGGNIFEYIGYSPSYFSQLEILSKRIYQNPDFYANLYDTPANVSRKKVAMKAIELMVDREIYESQLRREMSISVLLASKLRGLHREVNKGVNVSGNPEN